MESMIFLSGPLWFDWDVADDLGSIELSPVILNCLLYIQSFSYVHGARSSWGTAIR